MYGAQSVTHQSAQITQTKKKNRENEKVKNNNSKQGKQKAEKQLQNVIACWLRMQGVLLRTLSTVR